MKKFLFLLLFCSLCLVMLFIFLLMTTHKLSKDSLSNQSNTSKIIAKIDEFRKYPINEKDFAFLTQVGKIVESDDKLLVTQIKVLKNLMYLLIFISGVQICCVFFLLLQITKKARSEFQIAESDIKETK